MSKSLLARYQGTLGNQKQNEWHDLTENGEIILTQYEN